MTLEMRLFILFVGVVIVCGVMLLKWMTDREIKNDERRFEARFGERQSTSMVKPLPKKKRRALPPGWRVIRGNSHKPIR
jgi:hypothetical protein